jgi:hypothetical protein
MKTIDFNLVHVKLVMFLQSLNCGKFVLSGNMLFIKQSVFLLLPGLHQKEILDELRIGNHSTTGIVKIYLILCFL